ncbi:uncharacterized protein LOC144066948 [Stigmatopora argus]
MRHLQLQRVEGDQRPGGQDHRDPAQPLQKFGHADTRTSLETGRRIRPSTSDYWERQSEDRVPFLTTSPGFPRRWTREESAYKNRLWTSGRPILHSSIPWKVKSPAKMPSQLETAMESLIVVFHRYASQDGTLSRRELRELMENELSNFLKSQKDPAAVDKIMKDLDTNKDGQVDFEEFVSLVVGLSIACEQCYALHMKTASKK